MNTLKNLCVILILCLFSVVSSHAQTKSYMFSDLAWTDTVDEVDKKLRAAGYSGCEARRRLECKATGSCNCSFNGAGIANGNVIFQARKLSSVVIGVIDEAAVGIALTQKYGEPAIRVIKKSRDVPIRDLSDFGPDIKILTWRSLTGDTIVLNGGVLNYASGSTESSRDRRTSDGLSRF